MKSYFIGRKFSDEIEILKEVKNFMKNLDTAYLLREFENLLVHIKKVIEINGDYEIKR